MNPYDIAIVVVGCILIVIGAIKGVLRMLLSIASLILALIMGSWFGDAVGSYLGSLFSSEPARGLAGFVIVFLVVVIAGLLVARFVGHFLEKANLRWIDRLVGAVTGFATTIFLFGSLLVPLVSYLPAGSGLVTESRLAPWMMHVAEVAKDAAPEDLKGRFDAGLAKLKEAWKGGPPEGLALPKKPDAAARPQSKPPQPKKPASAPAHPSSTSPAPPTNV